MPTVNTSVKVRRDRPHPPPRPHASFQPFTNDPGSYALPTGLPFPDVEGAADGL